MEENFTPKKLLLLRILQILEEYSDIEHKLRQGDIMQMLRLNYDIDCERKAVARNIEFLQIAGYDIVSDKTGVYLASRKYTAGELRLLIDSVLTNRNVCKKHTKELIGKLSNEGGKYFKTYAPKIISLDDWQKSGKADLLLNVELLCEAIECKVQVSFTYNHYGLDKKLHPINKRRTAVNPYGLILKNSKYYLVCNYEGMENVLYCRVDRITDIEASNVKASPIERLPNYKNGINIGEMNNRLPYMYEDKVENIEFIGGENLIDDIVDWFGFNFTANKLEDDKVKFTVKASPRAMRFWVLQYGRYVKILSPQSLVDKIKEDIEEMCKLYCE